jgi:hypothetical protein
MLWELRRQLEAGRGPQADDFRRALARLDCSTDKVGGRAGLVAVLLLFVRELEAGWIAVGRRQLAAHEATGRIPGQVLVCDAHSL